MIDYHVSGQTIQFWRERTSCEKVCRNFFVIPLAVKVSIVLSKTSQLLFLKKDPGITYFSIIHITRTLCRNPTKESGQYS